MIFTRTNAILLALVILLALLQYKLWSASNGIMHSKLLQRNLIIQKTINDHLVKENKTLKKALAAAKQNHQMVENRARNELGMVKKGETYYQIVT